MDADKKKLKVLFVSLLLAICFAAGLTSSAGADTNTEKIQMQLSQGIEASQEEGQEVHWILPGPRELDSEIFGTPDKPLGFEHDIGVPIDERTTKNNGTEWNETAFPTPFSDKHAVIDGSFDTKMIDRSPFDGPQSKDKANGVFKFTGPDGENEYKVVLKKLIPVGPAHSFFGGVIVDGYLHGTTGYGTRLMPTVYTYGAFWGIGELYINGTLVSDNRLLHVMTTENVRDENYELMTDSELPHEGIDTHVMMPNVEVTPDGPEESPVPTQYELPNGQNQPFLHIMYEDTNLKVLDLEEDAPTTTTGVITLFGLLLIVGAVMMKRR